MCGCSRLARMATSSSAAVGLFDCCLMAFVLHLLANTVPVAPTPKIRPKLIKVVIVLHNIINKKLKTSRKNEKKNVLNAKNFGMPGHSGLQLPVRGRRRHLGRAPGQHRRKEHSGLQLPVRGRRQHLGRGGQHRHRGHSGLQLLVRGQRRQLGREVQHRRGGPCCQKQELNFGVFFS
jgi:hypothetical protein